MNPTSSSTTEHLTSYAARLFARALDRRFADGASSGPLPILLALAGGEALPQKQLAQLAAVEQSTMARTLGRMQRDELVNHKPDLTDGRSSLAYLTPQGLARAALALEVSQNVEAVALASLSMAERKLFKNLLQRVIGNLEEDQ